MNLKLLYLASLLSAFGFQRLYQELGSSSPVIGFVLIALGMPIARRALSCPGARGWAGVLGILVVQAFAAPAVAGVLARYHQVPGLAELLAALCRAFGLDAASSEGRVVLHVGDLVLKYLPSLSRLAAFPLALTMVGVATSLLLFPTEGLGVQIARFFITIVMYSLSRILLLIFLRYELPADGLETSPWFQLLTLAPAGLFLGSCPVQAERSPVRSPYVRPMIAFGLGFLFAFALGYVDHCGEHLQATWTRRFSFLSRC
jgi:hypothetical protein